MEEGAKQMMSPEEQEAKYRAVIKRTLERAKEIDEARKAAAKKHPMPKSKCRSGFDCPWCGSPLEYKNSRAYGKMMQKCTSYTFIEEAEPDMLEENS